jgi:hypothetical protein
LEIVEHNHDESPRGLHLLEDPHERVADGSSAMDRGISRDVPVTEDFGESLADGARRVLLDHGVLALRSCLEQRADGFSQSVEGDADGPRVGLHVDDEVPPSLSSLGEFAHEASLADPFLTTDQ